LIVAVSTSAPEGIRTPNLLIKIQPSGRLSTLLHTARCPGQPGSGRLDGAHAHRSHRRDSGELMSTSEERELDGGRGHPTAARPLGSAGGCGGEFVTGGQDAHEAPSGVAQEQSQGLTGVGAAAGHGVLLGGLRGRGPVLPPAGAREVPRPGRLAVNSPPARSPGPARVRSTLPAPAGSGELTGSRAVVPEGEMPPQVIGPARHPTRPHDTPRAGRTDACYEVPRGCNRPSPRSHIDGLTS